MKHALRLLLCLVLLTSLFAVAKGKKAKPAAQNGQAKPAAAQGAKPSGPANLESVLSTMDTTAEKFHTLQADFLQDQYSKVVEEHDLQKGAIYFRRGTNKEVEMMLEVDQVNDRPDKKFVQFSGGTLRVYQPVIDQGSKYNAGKNKAELESFLVLGFGSRGHDLLRSFDVKFGGTENLNGINTAKLDLTPHNATLRNNFDRIILWIDLARGISVQQQFINTISGDYRLVKYSEVKVNPKLSDDIFKLKTTPSTKWINPQG